MQNKFSSVHNLLDTEGKLTEAGWTDSLLPKYVSRNIKQNRMNMREWDRYIVVSASGEYALSMLLADKRSSGIVNACFYDIKNKKQYDCFLPVILPASRICLPSCVDKGSTVYKDYLCEFMYLVNDDRHLYCNYSNLFGNEIEANIHLDYNSYDSTLAVTSPVSDDDMQFCYNVKAACMPAGGYVKVNSDFYEFNSDSDFAVLDWGRGVWCTQNTKRVFACGCGDVNGSRFGFNIGYGIGDMSNASENAVFVDGVCHKLGRVFIDIPLDDRYEKWHIRSDDKRFEMTVVPDFNCNTQHNLGLKKFSEKVMFGRISGKAVLDNGETMVISEIPCFFEQSESKY